MELPKGFGINDLMSGALPGDLTLGEVKTYLVESEWGKSLIGLSKKTNARLRIRILDADGKELPDSMTLEDMRQEDARRGIHIVIDDGTGGMPALEPV